MTTSNLGYILRVGFKKRKIRGLEDRLIKKMTEMQYLVIFEKDVNSYGAYVPNLPGCVAIGETMEEVRELIVDAIQFHIEGLPTPPTVGKPILKRK